MKASSLKSAETRARVEDLLFIGACEKKKSVWKGRNDRPLIRIGADQYLAVAKQREGTSITGEGEKWRDRVD